ncbi:MAG: Asp-tRNA(Asn)/Glu-tRNA(Gln) amidotransferase subunit GatA, partial [Anaerolineae bacterium]|nr:Asp-tRNA(Asn)/Glu-tRNA(Gln) amidotransferase subunit GatA [Anaerolineae bacterium]
MTDLTHLTISEALAKMDAGEITSVQLTQAYLDKIQQLDPQIKAYLTVTSELALQLAQQAD